MKKLELDLKPCDGFFNVKKFEENFEKATSHAIELLEGNGRGNDFTGWIDLPLEKRVEETNKIKNTAERLRENSDYIINIGIGGSYLGTKAVSDFVFPSCEGPEIIYAGNTISGTQIQCSTLFFGFW